MRFALTNRTNRSLNQVDEFRNSIAGLFDDFFSFQPTPFFANEWQPAFDVKEDKTVITVKAEVPGMEEKDLSVSIEQNVLTIAGEKKKEKSEESDDKRHIVSERHYGSFSRSVKLPDNIKHDEIKADFKNGVLSIEIPKEEAKEPKQIKIDVQ